VQGDSQTHMQIDVANCNRVCSKYPITVDDKGWVYGVWYCGTSFTKVKLHGQYPPTFLKRALSLFPEAHNVIHCPSGTLNGTSGGVTVDLIEDDARKPDVTACASDLPFLDSTFDLYLSDPPYTDKDAEIYGTPPFPLARAMDEARRVLVPGGYFGILHTYYPSYRRREWKLRGLIAVVTGFQRATRMFSIFESLK
jgi:SAM-dependent methyltransferase